MASFTRLAPPSPVRFAHPNLMVMALSAAVAAAFVAVAFFLWPTWPGAGSIAEAPTLPIVIADTIFQIPPQAIRLRAQRRSGVQDRVDIVLLWPSLQPPDPTSRPMPEDGPLAIDRVFVTLAAKVGELSPRDRLQTIYPRYLERQAAARATGLSEIRFRDGSPYQGEDLIYDGTSDGFAVRCTRDTDNGLPGTCLHERFLGGASITTRFPRAWLEDWRAVARRLDDIVSRLSPAHR
jgi:hypothetical protein